MALSVAGSIAEESRSMAPTTAIGQKRTSELAAIASYSLVQSEGKPSPASRSGTIHHLEMQMRLPAVARVVDVS